MALSIRSFHIRIHLDDVTSGDVHGFGTLQRCGNLRIPTKPCRQESLGASLPCNQTQPSFTTNAKQQKKTLNKKQKYNQHKSTLKPGSATVCMPYTNWFILGRLSSTFWPKYSSSCTAEILRPVRCSTCIMGKKKKTWKSTMEFYPWIFHVFLNIWIHWIFMNLTNILHLYRSSPLPVPHPASPKIKNGERCLKRLLSWSPLSQLQTH